MTLFGRQQSSGHRGIDCRSWLSLFIRIGADVVCHFSIRLSKIIRGKMNRQAKPVYGRGHTVPQTASLAVALVLVRLNL